MARSDYDELVTSLNSSYTIDSKVFGTYEWTPDAIYRTVEDAKGSTWDYVLLATKALRDVDPAVLLEPIISENTTVVFLQNGIGNERTLAEKFGAKIGIATAVVNIATDRPSAGRVNHYQDGRLRVGPYTGEGDFPAGSGSFTVRPETSEKLRWLADKFNAVSVPVIYTDDVLPYVWSKLAGNNAFNPTTALSGSTCLQLALKTNPAGRATVLAIQEEVYAAARAHLGSRFPPPDMPIGEASVDAFLGRLSPEFTSSMAQDYLAGRACEVDSIIGEVVKRAQEKGISVPRVETMFGLMSTLDALNPRRR